MGLARDVNTSNEPHSRLTRLTNKAIDAVVSDPEYTNEIKLLVLIDDGENGGIGLSGYDGTDEAITDLLTHLDAVVQSTGRKMMVVPIGRG